MGDSSDVSISIFQPIIGYVQGVNIVGRLFQRVSGAHNFERLKCKFVCGVFCLRSCIW